MTASRFGRFQKATALLPLALLSAAVTASLVGMGPSTTAVAGEQRPPTLPDGTSVPEAAIEAPASVSLSGSPTREVDAGLGRRAQTASTSGIPAAALAAYQRAETVINAADPSCKLSWQLIAAIGRVESDHGRVNGNSLSDAGVAQPGIYGIALDGTRNTQAIRDTDAGQYDADATWDRAVGPMQFIPATWSVVGVDGDNDGKRNPQDVDDAALVQRRLPLLRQGRPLDHRRPARRGLPLQPQQRVRRPGAVLHGLLHLRRLHLRPQRHQQRGLHRPRAGAQARPGAGHPAPGRRHRRWRDERRQRARRHRRGNGGEPTEEPTVPIDNGGSGGGGGNGGGGGGGGGVPNVPRRPGRRRRAHRGRGDGTVRCRWGQRRQPAAPASTSVAVEVRRKRRALNG